MGIVVPLAAGWRTGWLAGWQAAWSPCPDFYCPPIHNIPYLSSSCVLRSAWLYQSTIRGCGWANPGQNQCLWSRLRAFNDRIFVIITFSLLWLLAGHGLLKSTLPVNIWGLHDTITRRLVVGSSGTCAPPPPPPTQLHPCVAYNVINCNKKFIKLSHCVTHLFHLAAAVHAGWLWQWQWSNGCRVRIPT